MQIGVLTCATSIDNVFLTGYNANNKLTIAQINIICIGGENEEKIYEFIKISFNHLVGI